MAKRENFSNRQDHLLGMDRSITRRDFLDASLLGAGSLLLRLPAPSQLRTDESSNWNGYGGVGDYANSNGNTWDVMNAGHAVRDGRYEKLPPDVVDTGEIFDLVVVGGGISGLGAAYYFKRAFPHGRKCLIIENHPIFGGEAKRNEFIVNGQRLIGPQGSNDFAIPRPGDLEYEIYTELGLPRQFQYQIWSEKFKPLQFARDNYGFQLWADESPSFGYFYDEKPFGVKAGWAKNIWGRNLKGTPYAASVRRDFLTWRHPKEKYYQGQDFERWLDTMTYKDFIEKIMRLSPEVTKFADPIVAAAIGLGCDVTSAYAAFQIQLPGVKTFLKSKEWSNLGFESFPGGNAGFARHFLKALIPEAIEGDRTFEDVINGRVNFGAFDRPTSDIRLRVGATAVLVKHDAPPQKSEYVWVAYAKGGRVYRVKGRGVVMAGGSWMSRAVVRDLPQDYASAFQNFYRSPMLVVNVAVTNWRFLYKLGLTACRWFDGFGFCCNIRQPMMAGDYRPPLDPDQPTIVTFYVPFYYPGLPIQEQGNRGRLELLSTSYSDYERQIRLQMLRLFGRAGFNPGTDMAGVILNRWGHAYVDPQPGFYFGRDGQPAPREIIRKRFGRVTFAHSELQGHQDWIGGVEEGRRATNQVLEVV